MKLEIYHNGEATPWIEWNNVTQVEVEDREGKLWIHIYRFHSYHCSKEIDLKYDWFRWNDHD